MKTFFLFVSTVLLFQITLAVIIHVPGDYTSIQAGLNAAGEDDTVLVQPGTYAENIVWPEEHGIKLIAAGDTTNTFIDGNYSGSVIRFPEIFFYDLTTLIKGFTITHGSSSGIYMSDAEVILDNLHITKNEGSEYYSGKRGGGIICFYSSPTIKNSKIDRNENFGNTALGGGVYLEMYSSPQFYNVIISENTCLASIVAYGGGVYLENHCDPMFINVSISHNIITGEECWGAGVYSNLFCYSQFDNSQIENNLSNGSEENNGGGIYSGIYNIVYLNRSIISNNGLMGLSVLNCGAGLFFLQGQLSIINCLITNNYIAEETNGFEGLGMYIRMVDQLAIINSTVAGNCHKNHVLSAGSAIKLLDITGGFKNSIFWNENLSFEIESSVQNELEISYSNIKGGWEGTENIDEDPLFVDDSTFSIQLNSPCVNAGTNYAVPFVDILGNPRPMPMFTNPDMGAYEVDQPVGLSENDDFQNISVFPNPVLNKATIRFPNPENSIYSFQIFDTFGNVVEEYKNISGNEFTFQRDDIISGIYLGKLIGKGNKANHIKFLVR